MYHFFKDGVFVIGFTLLSFFIKAAEAKDYSFALTADYSASPCKNALDFLQFKYNSDKRTRDAFESVFIGLQPLPVGYAYHGSSENPWRRAGSGVSLAGMVIDFYAQVCTLLPQISGTNDNALDSIQYFAWFYNHNQAGVNFVSGIDPNSPKGMEPRELKSLSDFLILFNADYKKHMSSKNSTAKVPEWIADPRIEIQDYQIQKPEGYQSWNEFFARNLTVGEDGRIPSRPVTMPERDYVIVSPTDCIMNPLVQVVELSPDMPIRQLIDNPLQLNTVLDVKNIPLSVDKLLANAPLELKQQFVGGTGLACVLMPNTYHHFHSPVDGIIEYAEIVEARASSFANPYAHGTFGYSDWPNWVPDSGDVGRPGTDFSQFQGFQRGVVIIKITYKNLPGKNPAELTGYVASIPVGLDTVGSVVLAENVKKGVGVKKGVTPLGNFFFGGSLNILIFSPIKGVKDSPVMVSPAVQTRMGNQIGILNTPYPAAKTPWTPD